MVKVPIDSVFIIADSADKTNDKATKPSNLDIFCTEIGMFPADADVFLVNAYSLWQRNNITCSITDMGVEVMNFPKAVAPQLQ